jgi:hypothetical protein
MREVSAMMRPVVERGRQEVPPGDYRPAGPTYRALALGLGVRRLNVAPSMNDRSPPPPAPVRSCGHGVEARLLAILDGHQAWYTLGMRREERGRLPCLQEGLQRLSRHDEWLGQILEAL